MWSNLLQKWLLILNPHAPVVQKASDECTQLRSFLRNGRVRVNSVVPRPGFDFWKEEKPYQKKTLCILWTTIHWTSLFSEILQSESWGMFLNYFCIRRKVSVFQKAMQIFGLIYFRSRFEGEIVWHNPTKWGSTQHFSATFMKIS